MKTTSFAIFALAACAAPHPGVMAPARIDSQPTQRNVSERARDDAAAPRVRELLTGPPALACETFPQAQRAVATGRYAAILPTFARRELSPRVCHQLAVPLPSRKVSLAWHRRLERQQPRVVALIDPLATAFAGAL